MLACIGGFKQLESIDRRHWGLHVVPEEVYRHERTLEELNLDFNAIQELPPKFFRLCKLQRLTLCENELNRIPPGIANFTQLSELDVSKNAIEDIPLNLQFCRVLRVLELSSNPLLRTPESVANITSLVHLILNDVGIPRLPLDIGNLTHLKVLEARENTLKTLPLSISKLKKLERLDVGNNEIEALPDEVGDLEDLTELWVDTNFLSHLPETVTQLKKLTVLDVTKNRLEELPMYFSSLSMLSDLHISSNLLEALPEDFGSMKNLTLLKMDSNHFMSLPQSIGKLDKVMELLLFDNMLETVPPSLFEMKSLEMLNLDRNHLIEVPATVGQCQTLHVMSVRENELCELPEELGSLKELRVLDIIGNRIRCLPISFSNLQLDAFWIDSSQPQPLVMLDLKPDPEDPEVKVLSCNFLPQRGPYNSSMENFLEDGSSSSEQPGNPSPRTGSVGREGKLGVAFDPAAGGAAHDEGGKLVRFPTPFRKDLKALKAKRKNKYKPTATPSTTIFRKGSTCRDDFAGPTSLDHKIHELKGEDSGLLTPLAASPALKSEDSLGDFKDILEKFGAITLDSNESPRSSPLDLALTDYDQEPGSTHGLSKSAKMMNLSEEDIQDVGTTADKDESGEVLNSVLRVIEVTIEIDKEPGQTLGFSIAGGRGSTPAYEDVDDSVYVTKVAPGGLADEDGRIHLGDRLLSVNHISMVNATHAEAVAALKSVTTSCHLIISREVVVVMPTSIPEMDEEQVEEAVAGFSDRRTESPAEQPGTDDRAKDSLQRNKVKVTLQQLNDGDGRQTTSPRPSSHSPTPTPPASNQQHDRYINYDIAQSLVKGQASKRDKSSRSATPEYQVDPQPSSARSEESSFARRSYNMSIDDDEEDFPTERVVLDRAIGKLGLSIVGGADHVSRVFGQGKPGLYVSKISKGGAAAATKKIKLGDRILEVNKFNVRYSTHQQAVQWLVSQEGDIELLIQHVPQPPGLIDVCLKKEKDQKLGLSIRGGGKDSKGNPLDLNDEGIFISKISEDGLVKKDGRLKVGMRIVEVNGVSLLAASHKEAVKALRSTELNIMACNGFDPEEVLLRRAQEEAQEAERISSITEASHIPLSAASSMMLDSCIHGLLSESSDKLYASPTKRSQTLKTKRSHSAVAPPYFSLPRGKLSQSYNALDDNPPEEEKSFDTLMDELSQFKIETSQEVEDLNMLTRNHSTPPPELDPIPISDIIGPLQFGVLMNDNAFALNSPAEESFASELSKVEMKDTGTMLADIDSEVSLMAEEVSKGEDDIKKSEENEGKDVTPKVRRRGTQRLKLPSESTTPKMASPETRRRAEMITLPAMADPKASEEAVKSIIGEVFDDFSLEEYEKPMPWSGRSSGIAMAPSSGSSQEDMSSLLKALSNIGSDKKKPLRSSNTQSSKASSSDSMEVAEPSFGKVPSAQERASTMPAIRSGTQADFALTTTTTTASTVVLRNSTAPQDYDRRKSAPPVAEKPVERLTFKEKLEFHKKVADSPEERSRSDSGSSLASRPKPISVVIAPSNPSQPPPPAKRTSSAEKPSPTSPTELLSFTERRAMFHSNQSNDSAAKKSPLSDNTLSAEERRLARIVGKGLLVDSKDSAPVAATQDATSIKTVVLASNSNNNNNNNNNSPPLDIPRIIVTNNDSRKTDSKAAGKSKKKNTVPKTML